MSDSSWPHGLQHTRLPCPSPTPRACSNSCPLSLWCHPTISSFAIPFSSCLQSFPAPGSFPMSQFFESGGRSIGVSASASVLPMNIQDWFPLGWTGLISLQLKPWSYTLINSILPSPLLHLYLLQLAAIANKAPYLRSLTQSEFTFPFYNLGIGCHPPRGDLGIGVPSILWLLHRWPPLAPCGGAAESVANHAQGLMARPEQDVPLLFCRWLGYSHTVLPKCKGGWVCADKEALGVEGTRV